MISRVVLIAGSIIALILAVRLLMPAVWWAIGRFRVWRAGPRPLHASAHRLWRDPGAVTALDAIYGPGHAGSGPQPPFQFLEEHTTGSQPTVSVRDGRGKVWRVKWGQEVRCETFAVRVASACGSAPLRSPAARRSCSELGERRRRPTRGCASCWRCWR